MEKILTKTTLDEYLAKQGLSFPVSDYMLDKLRNPHGLTLRQRKKLEKDNAEHANEYASKRRAAIEEYNRLVEAGEIVPKTGLEQTIETAKYGHLDNESTQAAIRVLKKRGIPFEREAV